MRALIYLDGISSAITHNYENIKRNILQGCRCLGLETVEYKNTMKGFIKLREDMNQPDTLLICTDSLAYHLCMGPVIVISRSIQWVQSSPKPNCIGRLTQEMIGEGYAELVGMIARNKPMRQFYDHKAATTFLLYNEYHPKDTNTMGRFAMAMASWCRLAREDYNVQLLPFDDEGTLPFVSQILQNGIEFLHHPDDILIFVNRDICLTTESVGIIRAFMDSRDITACYSHRVDIKFDSLLSIKDLKRGEVSWGIDLFAFRKDSPELIQFCQYDMYLGRQCWDLVLASIVKHRLPIEVAYHYPHIGDWEGNDPIVEEQNRHNQEVTWKYFPDCASYDKSFFQGLGPVS